MQRNDTAYIAFRRSPSKYHVAATLPDLYEADVLQRFDRLLSRTRGNLGIDSDLKRREQGLSDFWEREFL